MLKWQQKNAEPLIGWVQSGQMGGASQMGSAGMDIRDMEILNALSQHGHFQRAANACGISQPAFSTRLRKLESKLGVQLVRRGNKFVGLTSEGEIALLWARRILQDAKGMQQEIDAAKRGLSGRVTMGVVPTAVAFAAKVASVLRKSHPGLSIEIRSGSADQIQLDLTSNRIDVGITYQNHTRGAAYHAEHLYDERYVLVAPRHMFPEPTNEISWQQAAAIPLCLLSSDMNNRRIVDQVFADIGVKPIVTLETNAFVAALVQVEAGLAGTIAPEFLVENIHLPPELVVMPLVSPDVSEPIALATAKESTQMPLVLETLKVCRALSR